ncbi:S53 family peptidase [Sporolactobacillus putidus]|uniref:Aspartyl protease n=1 Tax=Sporolactobacillus putidus TaxID=492735 RepID=A0A917W0B7_9BACL|nr:protease pro-enzyme activation domain-containing protein [Sporolactobacillus putidus]GGL45990.1 aspartyl protease [Sporolactobacillus putidus]
MKKTLRHLSSIVLSLFLVFASVPALAAPSLTTNDQQLAPVSQGTGTAVLDNASYFGNLPDSTPITVDIILKARNENNLQQVIDHTVDPKSKSYHAYLSVGEFSKNFGALPATVSDITDYLKKYRIDTKVYPDNLVITANGTVGAFNQAFNVTIQRAKYKGKAFHATKKGPKVPKYIAKNILAVLGLSNYSNFTPRAVRQPIKITPKNGSGPLNLNPSDFMKQYNVSPLYDKGDQGRGQTIGIVTLANFNPEDAYTFWKDEGIATKPGRISVKPIDGGSDYTGYEETTLDVQQSGALAPQSDINVYVGPNTDAGFVDAFATAINENKAAQLSVSWGLSETAIQSAVQNQTEDPAYALVFNQLFEQAAAQGISMFASAGDAGSYDATRDANTYNLAIDNPADSPYITAAGGTTLPWSYTTRTNVQIDVAAERAWGWDYLYPYFDSLGLNNPDGWLNYYFVGGGGGFSSIFPTPDYQNGISGVNHFTAVKVWQPSSDFGSVARPAEPELVTGTGSGRNLPDVALNADPYTGYKVFISDPGTPGTHSGFLTFGGTSVVSPQLAGLTALMNSGKSARIGFWNDQIYRFAKENDSPFHPLNTTGASDDNLFYTGTQGTLYNQATGLGTIDFTKLDSAFSNQ